MLFIIRIRGLSLLLLTPDTNKQGEKLKKNMLDTLTENLRHPNGQIQNGFIIIEKGNSAETSLEIVEGMQFNRGYLSKYFTDRKTILQVKGNYPIVIIAENVEKEALAPVIRNKLKGILKDAAVKAPAFGTVIREDVGLTLERFQEEMLGNASKVVIDKDSTLIVTDGIHGLIEC
ncbi:TCP-1/cpn60 chaperonin family protein [Artemisia annua]|uniref:TCP-1/cpn60 chaperonin family protein n=1 Tax=Artemisia annua TaxID=35608 RepID=A0A2U1P7Z4_ARTAN|nr:TCP-1/cpn60 chaperonin family protein [Artemisia annua]